MLMVLVRDKMEASLESVVTAVCIGNLGQKWPWIPLEGVKQDSINN